MAMGAKHGVLLSDDAFSGSDGKGIATILAAFVKKGHYDLILTGSEWIIQQRRQHSAYLSRSVLGLDSGEDQVVMALLDEGREDRGDAFAVRSAEGIVGEQHAVLGSHGHLPAQNLFVIVAADRDDCNVAARVLDDA